MRASTFLLSTLTAAQGVMGAFSIKTTANTATSKIIPVLVGGDSLTFTPNFVTANVGDIVQFQFGAKNHTVTQSSASAPCQPLADAVGVHSGFIPFDGGASGMVSTFNMFVNSTEPMYLYCAQAMHCQSGMVMMVNGQESALMAYAASAATATTNQPAAQVAGGCEAQIPLAGALVPTAAATASGSGATATEYTTVVVNPSGMPISMATATSRPQVTGSPNGTAPFVQFTGAASSLLGRGFVGAGGRGWMGSVAISAAAMALGAVLLVNSRR